MTAKEFLQKGRQLNFELEELKEARERAFGVACSASVQGNEERVQTSSGNATEGKFITYSDYSIEIDRRIKELSEYRSEMLRAINTIESSVYRSILIARYINCKRWEDVAAGINRDLRYTFKLHRRALQKMSLKT